MGRNKTLPGVNFGAVELYLKILYSKRYVLKGHIHS